jgi:hypothetical protein
MSTPFLHKLCAATRVLLAALMAACLLPAAAHAAGSGTAPAAALTLKFTVTDAPAATPQPATLTCFGTWANATGYLREAPDEACQQARRLADFLPSAPDPNRTCTQIFGGPQTATVKGAINGRQIRRAFSRKNGCELADWDRMGPLLAATATATNPARQLVDYHRSGGIAGLDDRLTISRSGVGVHTPRSGVPRVFRISPATLADLQRALDAADFQSLDPVYRPTTPIADAFTYTITHLGRTVVASDGAVPTPLAPVIDELDRLLVPDAAATAGGGASGP